MGEVVDIGELDEEIHASSSSSSSSQKAEAEAENNIYKYIFGFVEMAVVKCAIELNIAEAIESHDHPSITLSSLSSALNCDPSMLYRIMRFLTHRNIFKHDGDGAQPEPAYAHTPLSRLLIKNSESSMAAFVMLESSPVMLAPWQNLSGRVRANGTSSFEKSHGKDVWGYAEENEEHSELINEAMACDARRGMREIVEHCPEAFEGVKSVVDVGGGTGTAMRVLVRACPWLRGINFDLPHVVSKAPKCDGVEHVGGDMFEGVPKADAAFLMWVLHDWGDEECIEILKKCREAVGEKGRVMIAEAAIDEEGAGETKEEEEREEKLKEVGLMLDMVMMAHTKIGKERTEREWEYVIREAGFTTFSIRHIPSSVKSLIMAFP